MAIIQANMKRHKHLAVSFVVSLALHGLAVLLVAVLVMAGASQIVPVFKQGVYSVTLEPSELQVPPAAVPVEPVKKPVVVKPPEPKKEEKPPVMKKPEIKTVVADKVEAIVEKKQPDISHDDMAEEPDEIDEEIPEKNMPEAGNSGAPDNGVQASSDMGSYIDVHPAYPLGARLRGEEGVVVVRVTVASSGHAEKVEVIKSSGYTALDDSAVDALKKARFVAKNGGAIRSGQVTLPFRFKLVD